MTRVSKRKKSTPSAERDKRKKALALAMTALRVARKIKHSRKQSRKARKRGCTRKSRSTSVGASAIGSFALGAGAFGALAIGALAIRRLAVGRAAVGRLDIGELKVGRLEVDELMVHNDRRQSGTPPAAES